MAEACRGLGYAYQVLTDHSQSLAIAHGLDPDRVEQERAIIAELNARFAAEAAAGIAPAGANPGGFRLLHGCELEVRADGQLDYEDDLLARFDVVVASVHVARRQSRAELTRRTLNAIRSPHVDVIAHPSGRMIQTRDDLDLDWDAVFEAAAANGTALEINGSPHRLDLAPERARRALSMGCLLSIDSDAHRTEELEYVRWGDRAGAAGVGGARERAQHAAARRAARLGRRQAGSGVSRAGDGRIPSAPMTTPRRRLRSRLRRSPAASSSGGGRHGGAHARRRARRRLPRRRAAAGGDAGRGRRRARPRRPRGSRPYESLIVPAVLTGGAGAAIHLVPVGLGLVPVLLGFAILLDRILALELRLLGQATGATETDHSRVRLAAVVTAFIAFTGCRDARAGRARRTGRRRGRRDGVTEGWLVVLAVNDALVALLLGYRLAVFRYGTVEGRRAVRRHVRDRRRGDGRRGPGGRPAAARRARRC